MAGLLTKVFKLSLKICFSIQKMNGIFTWGTQILCSIVQTFNLSLLLVMYYKQLDMTKQLNDQFIKEKNHSLFDCALVRIWRTDSCSSLASVVLQSTGSAWRCARWSVSTGEASSLGWSSPCCPERAKTLCPSLSCAAQKRLRTGLSLSRQELSTWIL